MTVVLYAADISHLELTPAEYAAFIRSPGVDEQIAGAPRTALVVVRGDATDIPVVLPSTGQGGPPGSLPVVLPSTGPGGPTPGSLPVVVCWVGEQFGGRGPQYADVVVGESDVAELAAQVDQAQIAAGTLAVLLRAQPDLGVDSGLAAESAAYSVLQSGPEFAAWRQGASHRPGDARDRVVLIERDGGRLVVTLDRPDRHNAVSMQLRDELHEALQLAAFDDSIATVELRGNGPSFCSGGDLGEFGDRPDPATAHVTRLARSPARLLAALSTRTTAYIHGATMGGGIEMTAFAARVVADPDTRIALPEIGLGLIPGAGGTVSLTRRIGRQRTAALALTGRQIDAGLALEWGLVDEVTPVS